jgi:hypothetical protein
MNEAKKRQLTKLLKRHLKNTWFERVDVRYKQGNYYIIWDKIEVNPASDKYLHLHHKAKKIDNFNEEIRYYKRKLAREED